MTLIDELKALVEKYGYDPENGGIEVEACWNCETTAKGLPLGESLLLLEDGSYECSICSRKLAKE